MMASKTHGAGGCDLWFSRAGGAGRGLGLPPRRPRRDLGQPPEWGNHQVALGGRVAERCLDIRCMLLFEFSRLGAHADEAPCQGPLGIWQGGANVLAA